jgi:hypothetical protein
MCIPRGGAIIFGTYLHFFFSLENNKKIKEVKKEESGMRENNLLA